MANYSFVKYRESIINQMEWSNEKYLKFIEDYRKCRVLWDIRNPNYKNNNIKRKILIGLAQKYGMDEGSLRKKIKNLRSAFHREHHRLTNKMKGEEHDCDDVRKWFAYDALKFILDVTGPYIAKRDELSFSAEESFHEDDDQDSFDVSTQYIQLPPLIPDPEQSKSPETIPNPVMISKEEDEYDLFGRSMTMQLRKMPELVALDLMQKMQYMVFNARKQLSKEKRKKLKGKPHSVQSITTSKKKARSPSPMSHMSSPSSQDRYKIETMSPEADTTRIGDRNEDFSYEYVTTVEDDEHYAGDINEPSSSNMITKHGRSKRKNSKSIDPLEVKQSRISDKRIKSERVPCTFVKDAHDD